LAARAIAILVIVPRIPPLAGIDRLTSDAIS
jgi:hypothetical protein